MSRFQPTPRYSVSRGASFARKINANRTIAQSILDATIHYQGSEQVMEVEAGNSEQVGRIAVTKGMRIFIVRSKFEERYYIVTLDGQCSSFDDRVAAACLARVRLYRQQKAA